MIKEYEAELKVLKKLEIKFLGLSSLESIKSFVKKQSSFIDKLFQLIKRINSTVVYSPQTLDSKLIQRTVSLGNFNTTSNSSSFKMDMAKDENSKYTTTVNKARNTNNSIINSIAEKNKHTLDDLLVNKIKDYSDRNNNYTQQINVKPIQTQHISEKLKPTCPNPNNKLIKFIRPNNKIIMIKTLEVDFEKPATTQPQTRNTRLDESVRFNCNGSNLNNSTNSSPLPKIALEKKNKRFLESLLDKHYKDLDKFYSKYGDKFLKKNRSATSTMRIVNNYELMKKKEMLSKSFENVRPVQKRDKMYI